MKLAVVGSRGFDDFEAMKGVLDNILQPEVANGQGKSITIVSGGAKGADTLAEQYAQLRGYKIEVYPADWKTHGKSAGYRRNADIVKACDQLVAFWDGESPGTKHSVELAQKAGKLQSVIHHAPNKNKNEKEDATMYTKIELSKMKNAELIQIVEELQAKIANKNLAVTEAPAAKPVSTEQAPTTVKFGSSLEGTLDRIIGKRNGIWESERQAEFFWGKGVTTQEAFTILGIKGKDVPSLRTMWFKDTLYLFTKKQCKGVYSLKSNQYIWQQEAGESK